MTDVSNEARIDGGLTENVDATPPAESIVIAVSNEARIDGGLTENVDATPPAESIVTDVSNEARIDGGLTANAINIAAHQENPRKRKSTSDATESEPASAKRKRPSIAAPKKAGAASGKGIRPINEKKVIRSSPRKKREKIQPINQVELEEELNEFTKEINHRYYTDRLKHDTFAKMYYDYYGDFYLVKIFDFERKRFKKPFKVDNVEEEYDRFLIEKALRRPNTWVGNSPGAPSDGNPAPADISTPIPTIYQQHSNRYCLTYSLASALFYCGFKDEASVLSSLANTFSILHFDEAIGTLIDLMQNLVPQIGRPTIYQQRTKSGLLRTLTVFDVINNLSPYPTVIIPVLADGSVSHAFCVVDDLIFDSITPFALKLQKESLNWIFNDSEMDIYLAIRFATKVSPKGMKVESSYRRSMTLNWNTSQKINPVETFYVIAPENISTRIPTMCQQHDARFAMTYSLASALFYHGLQEEAFKLAAKAVSLAGLRFFDILKEIKEHMQSISQVTEYPKDHERKKSRRRGPLKWEDVFGCILPYPTVIIPVLPDGKVSLPFCVIGDLIFHSISPFALKLHPDTLNWLFSNRETKIQKALRCKLFIKTSQVERKN